MRSDKGELFEYIQCSNCNSLSILEIPENIGKYYENYYSFRPVKDYDNRLRKFAKKYLFKKNIFPHGFLSNILNTSDDLAIKAFAKINPNVHSKILDIGCGTGQLIYELYNIGFKNVTGIDPFLENDLVHINGSKVFKKSMFEEIGKWDIVMMNHVFEHMDNPLNILIRVNELLSDCNSIAIIRIPNVDSYAFRKFKNNWYGIQPPVHYALPSIESMRNLAQIAGLKIVNIVGENLIEFWAHSIAYTLDVWDYDSELGIRTFLSKNNNFNRCPPLISKPEFSYWKKVNKHILKNHQLCDWITFYFKKSMIE